MIRFALRLPEELHARLVAQAQADRRSVNSEILYLLDTALTAPVADDNAPGSESSS